MKYKKLLSLGIILLLALSQAFAQKQSTSLTLKSGDWFETDIRIKNLTHTSDYRFDVRYEVSNKTQNGDLSFKLSIERMRLKYADANNTWLGYDSYYPPYVENRKKNLTKQIYEITVDGQGKISKLKLLSTAPKAGFSVIDVKGQSYTPRTELSVDRFFPMDYLKQISETIINALLVGKTQIKTVDLSNRNGERNIANAVLKSASFKLLRNAVIKGKITNLTKADSLYSITDLLNDELFRFNKDGSFSANILAGRNIRRRWVFGKFDEDDEFDGFKTFSLLLEPLDTLTVKADALNFYNTVSFGGNAAAKAALSKDLVAVVDNQWVNKSNYRSKSIKEFIAFQKQGQKDFDGILKKYANRVSSEILDYCRNDFKYVQAGTKLMYVSEYRKKQKPNRLLDEFPKGFFLSIDTLPVSLSGSEGGMYYGYYLIWLLSYHQTKLGMVNADQYGFFASYATAMASFEGYPLYFSISEAFEKELKKGDPESTRRLKNYYEDFIHNCGNTSLTNRITELWTRAMQLWSAGNPSPVKQLLLKDGSTLDLTQFKGKPLVLIVNNNRSKVLKGYIDLIKKQNGSQVHFVIAQLTVPILDTIDQKLKELPNVTYVELSYDRDKQNNLDLYYQQTKAFTFDSDFRVISTYPLDTTTGDTKVMQELIKKAIDSSAMTKEQKAELIKTIGWSAGSILFAGLVFFWIYKARIANLKRKESLKRQIKELEVKAIRSQMNPHFIFNALNSIQSLINNQQYKEANIYLEKFALLIRRVLNNSERTFVSLSDELEAVTLYVELEQLRFDFVFDIRIDKGINANLIEIPGMITQPLIENAILHGIAQKGTSGTLKVAISKSGSYLKIAITDNGSGWNGEVKDGHHGFGLKLVRERLSLLNTPATKGNLEINGNLAGQSSGVTAVLTIPID
ncbi:two-component sensor histidine kinase [Pedobacter sp. AK017]|uniref:sensor histidine kinase n=1 Tax=Pedobacter sp. AK017 TaxID=2723073 RepID=UPI0016204718|nr:histidine kinase [Pedobacter sp. AK017]MBB5438579.1 two-component sensor histidine kinase [Pedobacter sp. AK017]